MRILPFERIEMRDQLVADFIGKRLSLIEIVVESCDGLNLVPLDSCIVGFWVLHARRADGIGGGHVH